MNEGKRDTEKFLGNYLSEVYVPSSIGSPIRTAVVVALDCVYVAHASHTLKDFTCFSNTVC